MSKNDGVVLGENIVVGDYFLLNELGQGAYGKAFLCQDKNCAKEDNNQVVIKFIDLSKVNNQKKMKHVRQIQNEIFILEILTLRRIYYVLR